MKIVAVNGGPRKNCNTAQLLDSFLNGVREAAPDADIKRTESKWGSGKKPIRSLEAAFQEEP